MIDCLPDEIIAEILKYVDRKDVIPIFSLVCKNWRSISQQNCKDLNLAFYCSEDSRVDDLLKVACSNFWSNCADYLSFDNCHLNDEHVAMICKAADNGHFKHVEYLSLSGNPIHVSSFATINESTFSKNGLKTVYFENCSITKEDIQKFLEVESHQRCLWFVSAAYFIKYTSQIDESDEKAYEYYEKAANLGDAESCYEFSLKYRYGEKDLQQELFWLTKAHEMGECGATARLADKYYENAEYESAFNFYSKAAEKGNSYAMLQLGVMYENGQYVERNYVESKKWIFKAVSSNEYFSPQLGIRYLNGTGGFEKDLRRAIVYFERYLTNSTTSKYQMAKMYLEGNEFVEKNVSKAIEMLEDIKYFDNEAALLLAKIYSTGLEGIKRNPEAAANLLSYCSNLSIKDQVELGKLYIEIGRDYTAEDSLQKAAIEGDLEALLLLAEIYEKRSNQKEANNYYLKAADKGDVESQYKVGQYYANGIGDFTDSIEYLSKAANSGHSKAQYELAQKLIESGNYLDAFKYINLSIEQGNGFAMNLLAKWYLNGTFVEKNECKAFELFEKSCTIGDCSNSFYELSILYENGIGCEANHEKYEELRMKAKDMGEEHLLSEDFFSFSSLEF